MNLQSIAFKVVLLITSFVIFMGIAVGMTFYTVNDQANDA